LYANVDVRLVIEDMLELGPKANLSPQKTGC